MPTINSAGRYKAIATKAEWGQSNTGTNFLRISFDTDKGHIFGWVYFSEKSRQGTIERLREVFGISNNARSWPAEIEGKECSIVVEQGEDADGNPRVNKDGTPRFDVKYINPVSQGPKPIDNEDSFLANLSAYAARMPAAPPKAAPVRAQAAPAAARQVARPVAQPAAQADSEDEPF